MKVSIITPCYNSVDTIGLTIDSVKSQTHGNIEHIVVDGGSTDGTAELLIARKMELGILISEKDRGIYDAINKGFYVSRGDIIGILNSDDCFFNCNIIERIIDVFKSNPEVFCVYGNLIFVNRSGKVKRVWHSKNYSYGLFDKSWTPAHPTFYCRRIVYNELVGYKIHYKIAADVDFMFRALEIKSFRSIYVNEYFVKMLVGGASNNGINSTLTIIKEMKKSYQENKKKLNMVKYIFYKLIKLKEFRF